VSSRRLKVLVVAAAAHPEKGSEPGLGWGWVEALSTYHDLWVITGEKEGNREAINRRFEEVPKLSKGVQVYFIPRPDGPKLNRIFPPFYYRSYRKWHQSAFRQAVELHTEVDFDLAHQLNMTGFREPGYLWRLNLPFVWGPVGGTANVPLRFASILGVRGFCYHLAKTIMNNYQLRYHKRVRAALDRTDSFVTSTSDTHNAFLRVLGKESVRINDNGPPINLPLNIRRGGSSNGKPIRLTWSGLHISRKALPILLRALADVSEQCKWDLRILGEGPMTRSWKRLARSLGIDVNCTWHGWVERLEAIDIMGGSDLFILTSLHESTPAVLFEAMSVRVPVICLDHCGQADVVNQECGVKIPVTAPYKVIRDLANVIIDLAKNPAEIERLSEGTQRRSKKFGWNKKAEAMDEVYKRAIANWNSKSS
jgi:glycosyltransferase involved in cell wall biosynthesis